MFQSCKHLWFLASTVATLLSLLCTLCGFQTLSCTWRLLCLPLPEILFFLCNTICEFQAITFVKYQTPKICFRWATSSGWALAPRGPFKKQLHKETVWFWSASGAFNNATSWRAVLFGYRFNSLQYYVNSLFLNRFLPVLTVRLPVIAYRGYFGTTLIQLKLQLERWVYQMHVWRRVEDALGAGWLWRCWYVKVKTYCWLFQVILGSKNTWLPCLVLLASQMNVPWAAAHLKTLWSLGQLGPCPSLRHGSDRPGERLKAIDQNLFQILMASVEHLYNWSPTLFVAGPLRKLRCLHLGRARADQDLTDLMGHAMQEDSFPRAVSIFPGSQYFNALETDWQFRIESSNLHQRSSQILLPYEVTRCICWGCGFWCASWNSHNQVAKRIVMDKKHTLLWVNASSWHSAIQVACVMCITTFREDLHKNTTIESTQIQEWTIWIINRCLSWEILGNTWHFPTFHSALSWRADRLWETQDIQTRPVITVVLLDDLTMSTQLVHRPAWLSLEPRFWKNGCGGSRGVFAYGVSETQPRAVKA